MQNKNSIIIYQGKNGEIQIQMDQKSDTIWARQEQIAELFDIDRTVATRHINHIFRSGEIEEKRNVQKMHIPNSDKPVKLYNLDVILAVGCRTNSIKAIQFRQWATARLKEFGILTKERHILIALDIM